MNHTNDVPEQPVYHEPCMSPEEVAAWEAYVKAELGPEPERPLSPFDDAVDTPREFKFDDLTNWRAIANTPIKWTFREMIPAGICGCISAPGGTGKSYLLLTLALSSITGKTLIESFVPVRPMRVVALFGEDQLQQVLKRLQAIGDLYESILTKAEVDAAIEKNLSILCANPASLTNSAESVVSTTSFYRDLQQNSESADLFIVDPVSKHHGLQSENDNAMVSKFMSHLDGLKTKETATLIYAHHHSKASGREKDSPRLLAARGASAFIDESRWAATLETFTEKMAEGFGLPPEEAKRYLELRVVKNSYTELSFEPIRLVRNSEGALKQTNIQACRQREVAEAMRDWLMERGLTLLKSGIEGITKSTEGVLQELQKHLESTVAGTVDHKARRAAITFGIDHSILEPVDEPGSGRGRKRLNIGPGGDFVETALGEDPAPS